MNWSVFIIGVTSGLLLIIVILELVRRDSLEERYALLWLVLAALLLLLSAWPGLLRRVADLLNVYYDPSLIFGLAFLFAFAIMIHFSVVLTRQNRGYNRMVQRLSLLEERVQRIENGEALAVGNNEEGETDNIEEGKGE